jgi:hypothetical protein
VAVPDDRSQTPVSCATCLKNLQGIGLRSVQASRRIHLSTSASSMGTRYSEFSFLGGVSIAYRSFMSRYFPHHFALTCSSYRLNCETNFETRTKL